MARTPLVSNWLPHPPTEDTARREWSTRWLRALWLALVGLTLAGSVAGVVVRARELQVVCLEGEAACAASPARPTPADAAGLAAEGLTLRAFAALQVGKLAFFGSLWIAVGAVVFARRGHDPMGLLTAFFLMTWLSGVDGIQDALVRAYPGLFVPHLLVRQLVSASFPLFMALFPNGRWAPRWTRWVLPAVVAQAVPATVINVAFRESIPANVLLLVSGVATFGFLLVGQVVRYSRFSTATERMQTRWVVAGVAACLVVVVGLFAVMVPLDVPRLSLGYFIGELVYQTAFAFIPLSIGLSILRYRLWDIDVIIRRTLVYSALTAVLGLAYLGSVLVLQGVFQAVTGEGQNALVVVLSTLGIAALFGPLRARVQRAIDRRFYRQKYNAAQTLAGFAASARDETDLERLSGRLVGVVEETMQPASVGLWLRKG
jgi:hypothetical protein